MLNIFETRNNVVAGIGQTEPKIALFRQKMPCCGKYSPKLGRSRTKFGPSLLGVGPVSSNAALLRNGGSEGLTQACASRRSSSAAGPSGE